MTQPLSQNQSRCSIFNPSLQDMVHIVCHAYKYSYSESMLHSLGSRRISYLYRLILFALLNDMDHSIPLSQLVYDKYNIMECIDIANDDSAMNKNPNHVTHIYRVKGTTNNVK